MKQQIQKQREQNFSIRAALTGFGTNLTTPVSSNHGEDPHREINHTSMGENPHMQKSINSFIPGRNHLPQTKNADEYAYPDGGSDDEYDYSANSASSEEERYSNTLRPVMRINPSSQNSATPLPPPAFRASTVTGDQPPNHIARLIGNLNPNGLRRLATKLHIHECPYIKLNEALNPENKSHRKMIRLLKLKTTLNPLRTTRKLEQMEDSSRRAVESLFIKCVKAEDQRAASSEEEDPHPCQINSLGTSKVKSEEDGEDDKSPFHTGNTQTPSDEGFFAGYYRRMTPFAERSTREKGMLVAASLLGVMIVGHFYSRITSPRRSEALKTVDPMGPYAIAINSTLDTVEDAPDHTKETATLDVFMSEDSDSVETVPDTRNL